MERERGVNPGIDRDVEAAIDAQRQLLAALDVLVVGDDLDLGSASRLPGWTRGHVLAHVRLSGDGHLRLIDAAARGEVGVQYPGGVAGRAADIEEASILPAPEQVDLLRVSSAALEAGWNRSSWDGDGEGPAGRVPIADLPFIRRREVLVHHVDLDIGYEFADLPGDYVSVELQRMERLWKEQQPDGDDAPLPDAALAVPLPTRLAWLIGRAEIEGLEPAQVF